MELGDMVKLVPNLAQMTHADKVKLFAWYIHTSKKQDRFDLASIRSCYDQIHLEKPANLAACVQKLQQKRPSEVLKDSRGYRLENRVREIFDSKYGTRPITLVVDTMLSELPGKITSEAERLFLAEAIACFRIKAFRASIIMTWNVAFDHFEEWIIANHLAEFNSRIPISFQKKTGVAISKKEDFSTHFKESEVIDLAKSAGIIHDNMKKILHDKLSRRNLAAHPSIVEINQYSAEDTIFDLVTNIILKLV